MTDDKPRKIWLQVYDQEGNYMAPEDRTFSANERVNSTDICYVRWGKTDILSIERDAALARAEAAEAESARLQYDFDRQLYRADARAEEAEAERNALRAELGTALDHLATAAHYPEVLLAAQQWRPVTEDWPHYAERVAIGHITGNWAAIATRVQSPDDDEWELEDGKVLDWESASVAIELPPLPQEPPQ